MAQSKQTQSSRNLVTLFEVQLIIDN
jgi:hypothetical protein